MQRFWFQLGTFKDISAAEITALLDQEIEFHSTFGVVTLTDIAQAKKVFFELGGSSKVWQEIEHVSADQVLESVVSLLTNDHDKQTRLEFSITNFDNTAPSIDPAIVKKELKSLGFKTKYYRSDNRGLSAAVSTHQEVQEVGILEDSGRICLLKQVASQNVDSWHLRDREKPFVDRKRGMLTPKLARMMINLGRELVSNHKPSIYDPFAGTGTVLMEAAVLDLPFMGSDLDHKAVLGMGSNLLWLREHFSINEALSLQEGEASRVTPAQKPDLIVTEPFLGKQTPRDQDLAGMFKGLGKLYLGAFKHWTHILADQAGVVIVFPRVGNYQLSELDSKLPALGFQAYGTTLEYSRPNARVIRQIRRFKFSRD